MDYSKTPKAVFLDRDGTINEDVGDLYKVEKLIFIPGAIKALKLLQEQFLLFIITNQAGIGKGNFIESEFLKFNKQLINFFDNYSYFYYSDTHNNYIFNQVLLSLNFT